MNFEELKDMIHSKSEEMNFEETSKFFEKIIFDLTRKDFIPFIIEIGTIPEHISHDSSEEKLYAKIADIVLAKSFRELGLSAEVVKARANCADVIAKSKYHSYSLVGDAKAFRLSRTAKNQKDFKVKSMVDWKGDNDFSVLTCPFFQYPRSHSQIYTQALDGNVLLFSWEHLSFLIENNIVENAKISLKKLWNLSNEIASKFTKADKEIIFWDKQDNLMCKYLNLSYDLFTSSLNRYKDNVILRGNDEIDYYRGVIAEIEKYSKKRAISELIKAKKLNEKISVIQNYISYLGDN